METPPKSISVTFPVSMSEDEKEFLSEQLARCELRCFPPEYSELKAVIREAARIRNESWDDTARRFKKTINECVCAATQDDDTVRLASILLSVCWNDALEFANDAGRIEDGS